MRKRIEYGADCFHLEPDRAEVAAWLRLDAALEARPAFEALWAETAAEAMEACRAHAALALTGEREASVFLTVGSEADARVAAHFAAQEQLRWTLLSTICDELLFQLDGQLTALIQRELAAEGLAIARRLEPGVDAGLEEQCRLFAPLQALLPEAGISASGVLTPSKSMMYALTFSAEPCEVHTLHDCANCPQKDCPYRDRVRAGDG